MSLDSAKQEIMLRLKSARIHMDESLLIAVAALLAIGYVMVTSASLHLGEQGDGNEFSYPVRQMFHILLGLFAAVVVAVVPTKFWEKSGQWLFLFGLSLLVFVLVPGLGKEVNGAVRWLVLGGLRIQVSEIVKLISVIYIAGYITRHVETMRTSDYGMVKPLMLLSFACVLLLLEPDFGAAVVILATALAMMFLGGARVWQFVLLVALVSLLGIALIYTSPYRMDRLTSFMDPWEDPLDTGFQLIQALIAFGRGEWFGVGLGGSVQKLFYLPEGHTDFLFSVIGEELGFAGVSVIIGLFSVIIWRAFWIGKNAEWIGRRFSAFLAYGIGIWFGLQAFVNMGVNLGILPTKGLTLPLMSYGGGSMIVMCCGVALLFRVHYETAHFLNQIPKRNMRWLRAS